MFGHHGSKICAGGGGRWSHVAGAGARGEAIAWDKLEEADAGTRDMLKLKFECTCTHVFIGLVTAAVKRKLWTGNDARQGKFASGQRTMMIITTMMNDDDDDPTHQREKSVPSGWMV